MVSPHLPMIMYIDGRNYNAPYTSDINRISILLSVHGKMEKDRFSYKMK